MKKITRQQIVDESRTWLGTPFHHQGRLKGIGVDCAGVVIGVAQALGLSDFDTTDYGRQPDSKRMRRVLDQNMDTIPINDALPGDVLWFVFDVEPQHVGIMTDIGILHAYAQVKKCVETSLDDVWKKRIRAAYRFRGIK